MGIITKIKKSKPYVTGCDKLKSVELKNGATLYMVLRSFLKQILDPNLNIMACGIAYNFLMSLFPGIIFLFTLIPFLLPYFQLEFIDQNLIDTGAPVDLEVHIDEMIHKLLPTSLYEFIGPVITDIASNKRGGLMSIGFFFAFYLSTNAMVAIMDSFNHYYQTKESRNWFHKRLVALGLTFALAIVVLLAIIVIVFGNVILEGLEAYIHQELINFTTVVLPYAVVVLLIYLVVSIIYYIAPAIKSRFKFFSIGSTMASLLIILVSQAFSYYVNNFGSYNRLYGSIGALVGLMVLFYAISYMILLGFQANVSLAESMEEAKAEKSKESSNS